MKNRSVSIAVVLGTVLIIGFAYAKSKTGFYASGSEQKHCCGTGGSIEGSVHDPKGQPVGGASIYAERTDVLMTRSIYALSDSEGKFLIKDLSPGKYILYGSKEVDGYPRTTSTFYYDDAWVPFPEITVYDGQVTSGVKVALGAKAIRLLLRVVDEKTQKPLKSAYVTLRRANNPNSFYSSSFGEPKNGNFEILVPSQPLTAEISAPGYRSKKLAALSVTDLKSNRLEVALQRRKQRN